MNSIIPSRLEWRLKCKGQPLGENIVSLKSTNDFDGFYLNLLDILFRTILVFEFRCLFYIINNGEW